MSQNDKPKTENKNTGLGTLVKQPSTYARELRPNVLWDAIKFIWQHRSDWLPYVATGVAIMSAAIAAIIQKLRGIPPDWFIISLLALFSLLLIMFGAFLERRKRKEAPLGPVNVVSPLSAESESTALPPTEFLAKIQSEMQADTPLPIVEIRECPDKWLHRIADADKKNIRHAVIVRGIDFHNEIREGEVPYVEFNFAIFNMSVYEVSIDNTVDGYIRFEKLKLTQFKEIVRNDAVNCPIRTPGCYFTLQQRLTKEEADFIMNSRDDKMFWFDGLFIKIIGGTDYPQVEPRRLSIKGHVSRKNPIWTNYDFQAE